jgi:hypothetical protein
MSYAKIVKEKVDPASLAIQQSKAVVIGTEIVYITYDPLIDQEVVYLVGDFQE